MQVLVDTASAYQNWQTEVTLGQIFAAHPDMREEISIHSKANAVSSRIGNLTL
eukprot:SAG11_NODE_3599_length_2346_cov_3.414775_4_plen_53_part_00